MVRLRSRLLGAAAAAAGLACAGLVAGAVPAAAAACSGTSGVTVVIDTGSSVSTRCAGGDPASALSALRAVASVTEVTTQPGFVCRIDGYPASDPCMRTPPASAYWAFFHAPAGGSWTYSSQGAGSHDPPAGSVIGFRFGSGQQPRTAPPAPSATAAPAPTTTAPRATTEAPRPTSASGSTTSAPRTSSPGSAAGSTGSTGGATGAATEPSRTRSGRPTPSPSVSPSTGDPTATASGSASASPAALEAEPTSADGSGGADTLLVAGALLALLGGGAGWFAWRRRSP